MAYENKRREFVKAISAGENLAHFITKDTTLNFILIRELFYIRDNIESTRTICRYIASYFENQITYIIDSLIDYSLFDNLVTITDSFKDAHYYGRIINCDKSNMYRRIMKHFQPRFINSIALMRCTVYVNNGLIQANRYKYVVRNGCMYGKLTSISWLTRIKDKIREALRDVTYRSKKLARKLECG